MERYYYRIKDAKTGELLHEGTSAQLVAQGVYKSQKALTASYHYFRMAKNPRTIFEREQIENLKPKKPKTKPRQEPYTVRHRVFVYTCYAADGQMMGQGIARELVARGIFGSEAVVHDTYQRRGGKNPRFGVARMTRKTVTREVPTRCPRQEPGPELPAGRPVPPNLRCRVKNPTPLMLDVRTLERYNAEARALGRPELSYGTWAWKGKPARP